MALRIPVTDDEYRALTTADVLAIIDAIDVAEENGDFSTAETYYGVLNLIIQKSSLLNDPEVKLNTILEWLLRTNKVIPPQYTALRDFRDRSTGIDLGDLAGNVTNESTSWITQCADIPGRILTFYFANFDTDERVEQIDVVNEEFSFLKNPGVRRCRLVADLFVCCDDPNSEDPRVDPTQPGGVGASPLISLVKRRVILAESKLSYWYEDSGPVDINTGVAACRRPVYQFWYDANDIQNYTGWKTFDNRNRIIPLGSTVVGQQLFQIFANSFLSTGKQIAWSDYAINPCEQIPDSFGPPRSETFYDRGSYFSRVLQRLGYKLYEDVRLYSGSPGQIQRLSRVSRQDRPQMDLVYSLDSDQEAIRLDAPGIAYPSKCFYKGEPICGGGEGITDCIEQEQPTLERRIKEDANGNIVYFEDYVTETDFSMVEGYPCYEGRLRRRIKYKAKERKIIVVKDCPGQSISRYEKWVDDNFTPEITEADEISIDYIDVRRAFTSAGIPKYEGCNGVEVIEDEEPYVDPSDPCGCFEVFASKVFIKYPDYRSPSNPALRIEGPQILSKQDFSGIGPGLKITKRNKAAHCIDEATRVYNGLVDTRDVLSGRDTTIVRGLFNASQSLDCYYTSSLQNAKSKEYYYEITDCDNCGRTPYFGVSYGNKNGSGSLWSGYEMSDTPSKAIYSQNRLLTLELPEKEFKFYTTGVLNTTNDIYVLHFNRNSIANKLDPGNFEISLAELNGGAYSNNVHTGSNVQISSSNKVLTFIDNSQDIYDDISCAGTIEKSYYLVSGSLNNGIHNSGTGTPETNTNFTSYGIVYPDFGLVVFDGKKLNDELGFNNVTGSNINGDNAYKLFTSISGAADIGYKMKARNVEHKTTNHYFIRVGSVMANYSNNPTYVIDNGTSTTTGMIKNECFKTDPVTYITTVGLYNNSRDLLAIAKLSKPIKKTQNTDLLIKIRLNW